MYGDCSINIERTQNGYLVRMTDPKLVEQNNKRDKGSDCCSPWQDPQVKYSFEDKQGVIDFITSNIDKALPVDEYSSTFDKEAKKVSKDD
jgi:hypothetical protein